MVSTVVVVHMPTITIRLRQLMHKKTERDQRFDNPITQQEIADAVGVTRATISDWAAGKVDRLDKDVLAKLCQYFNCEIGDLLHLEKDEVSPTSL
jgi:putative transcriptional regulator